MSSRKVSVMDESVLMTIPEVATALRINKSYLYALLNAGALRSVRLGRRRLITREALQQFIADREREAAADLAPQ